MPGQSTHNVRLVPLAGDPRVTTRKITESRELKSFFLGQANLAFQSDNSIRLSNWFQSIPNPLPKYSTM